MGDAAENIGEVDEKTKATVDKILKELQDAQDKANDAQKEKDATKEISEPTKKDDNKETSEPDEAESIRNRNKLIMYILAGIIGFVGLLFVTLSLFLCCGVCCVKKSEEFDATE